MCGFLGKAGVACLHAFDDLVMTLSRVARGRPRRGDCAWLPSTAIPAHANDCGGGGGGGDEERGVKEERDSACKTQREEDALCDPRPRCLSIFGSTPEHTTQTPRPRRPPSAAPRSARAAPNDPLPKHKTCQAFVPILSFLYSGSKGKQHLTPPPLRSPSPSPTCLYTPTASNISRPHYDTPLHTPTTAARP